ncbi:hypothetical protein NPIL_578081 [Nephila pilipes]|uniref:Uncharacterized protein n=1 Tax=Nephila pilipes TaxID=299642 RepID=A0A8X6P678_NEPPI|nr:hypothetical protein NPIL_578081 [Nephila pilipes]
MKTGAHGIEMGGREHGLGGLVWDTKDLAGAANSTAGSLQTRYTKGVFLNSIRGKQISQRVKEGGGHKRNVQKQKTKEEVVEEVTEFIDTGRRRESHSSAESQY